MIKKIPLLIITLCFFSWRIFINYEDKNNRAILFPGFLERGYWLNKQSSYFIPFCSFIGSIVIIFRYYYMKKEEVNSFTTCLTLFILFMLLLTSSLNVLSIFLGWEGVGLISFLLIGWFSSRSWAGEGSKKAVLFNRITDFFFLFIIVLEVGSPFWVFSLDSSFQLPSLFPWFIIPITFLISSLGKSAQFIFHPWLTSAIEGPTPVRSLLHRRTIVVAGVYLFLFFHSFFVRGDWDVSLLLFGFLSRITLLGRSLWALSQEDIKKVVALSTTRQLSLIIVLIYFNLPELAFIHIILHGFFKALIFIRRGVCIHSGKNSQDFRDTNLSINQPSLSIRFLLGNLGLMGFPFLGAFYRKHIILLNLELGAFSLIIIISVFLSFCFTIAYSFKIFLATKSTIKLSIKRRGEVILTILPLILLLILSLTGGLIENLEYFILNPKILCINALRKFNFFLIIFLRFFILYFAKIKSNFLNFFHSSYFLLILFLKGKLYKYIRDFLGEKLVSLFSLKIFNRNNFSLNLEERKFSLYSSSNFFSNILNFSLFILYIFIFLILL